MPLLLRLLSSTGARVAYVLLAAYLAFQGWMIYEVPYRIDPGLLATAREKGRVFALIRLGFPPERFHVLKIQDVARVRGVKGDTVEVAAIDADGIENLVRSYYWIRHIGADPDAP